MIDQNRDAEEEAAKELIRKIGDEALRKVAKEFGSKSQKGNDNLIEDDLGSSVSFLGHEQFPDCPACGTKWAQAEYRCNHILLEYGFENPDLILDYGPLYVGGVLETADLMDHILHIDKIGKHFHSRKEIQEKFPTVLQGQTDRVRNLVNEVINVMSVEKESDGSFYTEYGNHIPAFHRYLTKIVSKAPEYLKSHQFGIEFVLGDTSYVVHWTANIEKSGQFLKEELDQDIFSLSNIEQAVTPPT